MAIAANETYSRQLAVIKALHHLGLICAVSYYYHKAKLAAEAVECCEPVD